MPADWRPQPKGLPTGPVPQASPRPKAGQIPSQRRWRFSFRFWNQVKYFGVDQCDNGWFVSLLSRLKDLSGLSIEETTNSAIAGAIRYHPIDWKARSIPISKSDIDWLGEYSSPDYELVQFHVSKALGRVVGFFDEDMIFNIVLLDPLHNIQPSKTFGYRVRASHVADCELTRMAVCIERAVTSCKEISESQRDIILSSMRAVNLDFFASAVHVTISDRHLSLAYEMVHGGLINNIGEFLECAIDEWSEKSP